MASTKDLTIEEKLRALWQLQQIDAKIDEIRTLRGELPMEVRDLEDELQGLNKRLGKLEDELEGLKNGVTKNELAIKESEELIAKYGEQSKNVRNNREFEAINKEIELQELEIQLSKKKIKDATVKIKSKKDYLDESKANLLKKERNLIDKKEELTKITADTEKEEEKLVKKSESQSKKIEARFIKAYRKIRDSYRNGLAVVTVEREACGGCFAKIPPQKQLEIRQRKRILLCEHCGRLLVDQDI